MIYDLYNPRKSQILARFTVPGIASLQWSSLKSNKKCLVIFITMPLLRHWAHIAYIAGSVVIAAHRSIAG